VSDRERERERIEIIERRKGSEEEREKGPQRCRIGRSGAAANTVLSAIR
jgi:hypothetical protein